MTNLYLAKNQLAGKKVELSDITIRDGLQSLETVIDTDTKVKYLEGLILAGFKRMEATNYGHPKFVPFFPDATEVLKRLLNSETKGPDGKTVGEMMKQNGGDVELTAVAIHESGAARAFKDFDAGHGPDRILQMTSTCPEHQRANSGKTHDQYFEMTEQVIKEAHSRGMVVNGTVSTIWGSPFEKFNKQYSMDEKLDIAISFVKRYLNCGADDIELADHDGSVTDYHKSFEFFSRVLDPQEMGTGPDGRNYADPELYIAHFHTMNMASALRNAAAALKAGIIRFESCLSGIGGQPANAVDGVTIEGREGDYYSDHFNHGLISTEDMVTMFHQIGVDTGIDQDMLISLGTDFRKDVVDTFEAQQKKLGREYMKCRSYMLTTGKLPESVTQLYQ
ncbi:MAG: pyruvate carboxyltransferase [Desulfobacteraceae bacterium]|nr:MAG: pyruvate carboxyltransferase [Desulfobacteraceae bacterium]